MYWMINLIPMIIDDCQCCQVCESVSDMSISSEGKISKSSGLGWREMNTCDQYLLFRQKYTHNLDRYCCLLKCCLQSLQDSLYKGVACKAIGSGY